jgi:3-deoxy-D-manno-octulosonic-acid transferase
MRLFYSFMWWLALPLVLARLWWRGRKEPGYRRHLGERWASTAHAAPSSRADDHGARRVGRRDARRRAAGRCAAGAWPDCRILLTHMTPTGRATGKALFAKHGERVVQSYLPYDTGFMVRRFLRHFEPASAS